MGTRDSASTCEPPVMGEMPWVDTINIARLEHRVDEGILHYQAWTMQSRIELTRTVSDPATWKVISFSDEETEGEGDYGRASMILDGNRSAYYHNKWKNGSVAYPHTFVIEAPDTVTIRSIELYQSRESKYRAKQMMLAVSDNGTRWTTVESRLNIEDSTSPTIYLSEPVTAKYFRIRFLAGYGTDLVINELYFKDEYRLDDMLDLAQQIIDESDHWGGYAPADLGPLLEVYANGTCTDIDALRQAIEDLGETAQPLNYGVVAKAESFTPKAVYQIQSLSKRGDIISTSDDALSIVASNVATAAEAYKQPCRVTDPYCNWMILHSDKYNEYYLYNLGAKKYLRVEGTSLTLSDTPMPISIKKNGDGFSIGINGKYVGINANAETPVILINTASSNGIFQLRTNHYMRPDEVTLQGLTDDAEKALHENSPENLFMQALQTYSKAFVAQPNTSSMLVRNASTLSSNANNSQQEIHNLAKLIDKKTDTYYETWYSGITWPDEMSYIQARITGGISAFAFSFTPSQNPDYGLSDIPSDIIVSTSATSKNFLPIARLTEDMPTTISESYVSPVLFSDDALRFLRFQVMQTIGNRADSHIFAMSEFQVHEVVIDEEASPYYQKPWVKEAFDALLTEIQTMRPLIVAGTFTAENRNSLRQAIERAEQALDNTTEIKTVYAPSLKQETIYNLSGQRVNKAQKGIYIINGKKVLY